MKRWLVVCAGNRGRSPLMAALLIEAFAKAHVSIEVSQGGYLPIAATNAPIHPDIVLSAQASRYDFSGHRTLSVRSYDLSSFDKIVCIDEAVAHEVQRIGARRERIIQLAIPDPVHGPDKKKAWTDCGNAIEEAVGELIAIAQSDRKG